MLTSVTTTKKKSRQPEEETTYNPSSIWPARCHLASTSSGKAATSFLKIGPPKDLGDWPGIGKVNFSHTMGH